MHSTFWHHHLSCYGEKEAEEKLTVLKNELPPDCEARKVGSGTIILKLEQMRKIMKMVGDDKFIRETEDPKKVDIGELPASDSEQKKGTEQNQENFFRRFMKLFAKKE